MIIKYFTHFRLQPLFIAALFLLAIGCGRQRNTVCFVNPPLTSINIIDRNGLSETVNNVERLEQYSQVDFLEPQPYQKVLRVYARDAQGNIPAAITSYHPNGYPSQFLEVVNSRAYGTYKEWYPNGVLKVSAYVLEGTADIVEGAEKTWVFDGCCEAWNEQGNIEAKILYTRGRLEGFSTYYHPNGNIWKSIPYLQNAINGTAEIFCQDGTLLQSTNYCNGIKEGDAKRYWNPGCIACEESYCEGLLASGRYYDKEGTCICKVDEGAGMRAVFGKDAVIEFQEYHNGKLEGEVLVLDRYGRVANLYHAKNGAKHGEEIINYDAPRFQQKLNPKISINWFDGKIQGIVKTWYDNGAIESQREMSNNKRNGHSTAWYRDGTLMLIEEYQQDLLTKGEYYSKLDKFPVTTVEEGKGTATIFDSEGALVQKIEYKHGKPLIED
jgi:antitoxin component YwqK of YwqJK toxin-antitoxin module